MMTRLEQEQAELIVYCLPIIANALESIARSLEVLRGNRSDQPKTREDYGETGD